MITLLKNILTLKNVRDVFERKIHNFIENLK